MQSDRHAVSMRGARRTASREPALPPPAWRAGRSRRRGVSVPSVVPPRCSPGPALIARIATRSFGGRHGGQVAGTVVADRSTAFGRDACGVCPPGTCHAATSRSASWRHWLRACSWGWDGSAVTEMATWLAPACSCLEMAAATESGLPQGTRASTRRSLSWSISSPVNPIRRKLAWW